MKTETKYKQNSTVPGSFFPLLTHESPDPHLDPVPHRCWCGSMIWIRITPYRTVCGSISLNVKFKKTFRDQETAERGVRIWITWRWKFCGRSRYILTFYRFCTVSKDNAGLLLRDPSVRPLYSGFFKTLFLWCAAAWKFDKYGLFLRKKRPFGLSSPLHTVGTGSVRHHTKLYTL